MTTPTRRSAWNWSRTPLAHESMAIKGGQREKAGANGPEGPHALERQAGCSDRQRHNSNYDG